MLYRASSIFLIFLLASAETTADTISLKSGEQYSGALIEVESGIVSFRTKLAGRIMVPAEEVVAIDTQAFMAVTLNDQKVLTGRIETSDNQISVVSSDRNERTPLRLASIAATEILPTRKSTPKDPDRNTTASIETGYQLRSGTRSASGPTLDVQVAHEGESIMTIFGGALEYTDDADSANRYFSGELHVVSTADKVFRPTLFFGVDRDRNRTLDYRVETSGGVTTSLLADDRNTIDAFAGVGGAIERFDPDPLREDLGSDSDIPATARAFNRENLNLDLRIRYAREIFQKTTLIEEISVKPSLSDIGDLRAEFASSLMIPIAYSLTLKFDLLFNYGNHRPYNDVDLWNSAISAGVQVDF